MSAGESRPDHLDLVADLLRTEFPDLAGSLSVSGSWLEMTIADGIHLRVGASRMGSDPAQRFYVSATALPGSAAAAKLGPTIDRAGEAAERIDRAFVVEFRRASPYPAADFAADTEPIRLWIVRTARQIVDQVGLVTGRPRPAQAVGPTHAPAAAPGTAVTPRTPNERLRVVLDGLREPETPSSRSAVRSAPEPYGIRMTVLGAAPPSDVATPAAPDDHGGELRRMVAERDALLERVASLANLLTERDRREQQEITRLESRLAEAQRDAAEAIGARDLLEGSLAQLRTEGAEGVVERETAMAQLGEALRESRAAIDTAREERVTAEAQLAEANARREDLAGRLKEAELRLGELAMRAPAGADENAWRSAMAAMLSTVDTDMPDVALQMLEAAVREVDPWPELATRSAVLHARVGRYSAAADAFADLEGETLRAEERGWYVIACVASGRLPQPVDIVGRVDWTHGAFGDLLLKNQSLLAPAELVELTRPLLYVLEDALVRAWLDLALARPLTANQRVDLLRQWSEISTREAGQRLVAGIESGLLTVDDAGVADLLARFLADIGDTSVRAAGIELLRDRYAAHRDFQGLVALLPQANTGLPPDRGTGLLASIIRAATMLATPADDVDELVAYAIEVVDTWRRAGELSGAAETGILVRELSRRASPPLQDLALASLASLDAAISESDLLLKHEALVRRASNEDLREAMGGKHLMFVGGTKPGWHDEIRRDLGWDERSKWYGSSPRQKPPLQQIEAAMRAGRIDAVVLFVDRIGHASSGPIKDLADQLGCCLVLPAEFSRASLEAALRTAFIDDGGLDQGTVAG